jgi:hypothetical protein
MMQKLSAKGESSLKNALPKTNDAESGIFDTN